MTWVSSEFSNSCSVVVPVQSADSSKTRLEMLLEPGNTTVPDADSSAGRSRNSVENMAELMWDSASAGSEGLRQRGGLLEVIVQLARAKLA